MVPGPEATVALPARPAGIGRCEERLEQAAARCFQVRSNVPSCSEGRRLPPQAHLLLPAS